MVKSFSGTGRPLGPTCEDLFKRDHDIIKQNAHQSERDEDRKHQRVIRIRLARIEERTKAAGRARVLADFRQDDVVASFVDLVTA